MTKIQELQDEAAKAERLARQMMDSVTIERLLAFAAECRAQIAILASGAGTAPA